MGCGDECPYIPGKRYIDWDLPDPKVSASPRYERSAHAIGRRVESLVAGLDAG